MVREDATGLVGVITIDLADFGPATEASIGCDGHDDATLAQALVRLAGREPAPCEQPVSAAFAAGHPRWQRGRFLDRLAPFWSTSERLSANLGGLAAELEQAVAQVLKRIAASR